MKKKAKGKALEGLVNKTNIRYRTTGKALILYKGTSVTITNNGAMLEKGPPDYEGVLSGGKYISFDAKETGSTTSFSLSGIRDHQYTHLKLVHDLGGVGFFLIHFYNLHEHRAYKLPMDFLAPYWEQWKTGGRASIPLTDFNDDWLVPIIDYLGLL